MSEPKTSGRGAANAAINPKPNGRRYRLSDIESAIARSHGIIAEAARVLGCTPWTIYNWIQRHPRLLRVMTATASVEERLAVVESQLVSLIAFRNGAIEGRTVAMQNLDFGEAIRRLKSGKAVARSGWNGKNMFLLLTASFKYNDRIPMPETIVMRTAQGGWVAWLPSQTDVLAIDWVEVSGDTQERT